jgi:type VI protein secretion system component VasF
MYMTQSNKPKTRKQEKAYHKGFQEIANELIAHGIPLDVALKDLDVRPTKESIKDIFRKIAGAKYGIESTTELQSHQVDEVWEDMTKALSINTGVHFAFPSWENSEDALASLDELHNE